MATVIYLDIDDEITSAANRIRSATDERLALVLPSGSRLATSRINFRLLAREAVAYHRILAIIAPEGASRALAASAGLPVYSTVSEFEAAANRPGGAAGAVAGGVAGVGAAPSAGSSGASPFAGGAGAAGPDDRVGTDETQAVASLGAAGAVGAAGAAKGAGTSGAAGYNPSGSVREQRSMGALRGAATFDAVRARSSASLDQGTQSEPWVDPWVEPSGRGRGRGRGRRRWYVGFTALATIFLVGGICAYLFLPTASIVVRAVAEPVGPMAFTVQADPLAATVDPDNGVVPAQVVTYDLSVDGEFPATGKQVTETKASGSVHWTNCDPTKPYTIPAGTIAQTDSGTGFATTTTVFLPVAILSGNPPAITCQSRDVRVTATSPGTDGNVPAGSIDQVPTSFNSVVIRVTNPAATTGGTHTETKIVVQKDVDKAMASLTKSLADQFASDLADPAQTPAGTTVYPATATTSTPVPSVDPTTLVGQTVDTFPLGLTATGTATAVDPTLVQQLGEARITAAISSGSSLVADSMTVKVGPGKVNGADVTFAVTAKASQVQMPDADAIRQQVKGQPVGEVPDLLRNYGDATVSVWPAWVTTIPNFDFRLDVQTVSDIPTEASPTPGTEVAPSPAASSSTPPSAAASNGPSEPTGVASARPRAGGSAAPSGAPHPASPAPVGASATP